MTSPHAANAVLDDLAAEQAQLDALLTSLTDGQWDGPSQCSDWSVADVVLHLAQTEEAVAATVRSANGDGDGHAGGAQPTDWSSLGGTVEQAMAAYVAAERDSPQAVLARWRAGTAASQRALRAADPEVRVQWVTNAVKPATLATTRIAEHWTHAHDIADPLGLGYPDTERLRHVAWLAVATLPYAFAAAGERPVSTRCELVGPTGERWRLGPDDAPVVIVGSGLDLCRVGAQRLDPGDADLQATGPGADRVLALLRTFAI